MKAISTIVCFLSLLILSTGCRKEQEPLTAAKLVGTYKLTALISKLPDGTSRDLYSSLDACTKGETHVLESTQVHHQIDNCQQREHAGPWCLVGTDVFVLDKVFYDIVSYNGKNLVLSEDDASTNGRLIRTFSRVEERH